MEASALQRGRVMAPRSRRLLATFGDDRLVEQVRRGNDAAFEAVYDRHHRGVLAFCRHMLGSQEEAEDAVQQSFAAAYTDLCKDDRAIRLKAWLYTIARNRCLSILRARREQPAELDDDKLTSAGLVDSVQQRAELRELLHDLGRLPDDQREALVLFEIGDLSHKEIGDVLGVPAVKVKALVFQARSALIEQRDARAIPCAEIREQLATASGGALRRGPLRRHLKSCSGCSQYREKVKAQRRALAALMPAAPSAGLKAAVLAGAGVAGVSSTTVGGAGLLGSIGATKLALGAAAVAAPIAAGGIAVGQHHHHHAHAPKPATSVYATKTPKVRSSVSQSLTHSKATAPNPGPAAPGAASPAAREPVKKKKRVQQVATTKKKHAKAKRHAKGRWHARKHHRWQQHNKHHWPGRRHFAPRRWHAQKRSFRAPQQHWRGRSGRHGGGHGRGHH